MDIRSTLHSLRDAASNAGLRTLVSDGLIYTWQLFNSYLVIQP